MRPYTSGLKKHVPPISLLKDFEIVKLLCWKSEQTILLVLKASKNLLSQRKKILPCYPLQINERWKRSALILSFLLLRFIKQFDFASLWELQFPSQLFRRLEKCSKISQENVKHFFRWSVKTYVLSTSTKEVTAQEWNSLPLKNLYIYCK